MLGREIDGEGNGNSGRGIPAPISKSPAGLGENPAIHRNDESAFLGERQEGAGEQQAAPRVFPADEGFKADDAALVESDDRLEVEKEISMLRRTLEVVLETF